MNYLKIFGIDKEIINQLESYKSRDGFVKLNQSEFEETIDYFNGFKVYKNLIPILTDENSNYWCLHYQGPMKGFISYLSHDELDLSPKFSSTSTFIKVIEDNPDAYDFDELDISLFEFPSKTTQINNNIIDQLLELIKSENEADVYRQLVFSVMSLTSKNNIDKNIKPFLQNEDDYITEKANEVLKFYH